MIKAYTSLTAKEKHQVMFSLFLVAVVVASVSILFNITRGADVDYFKEHLLLSEARLNSIDKKIDDTRDKYDRQLEGLRDRTNETARKVEEHEKWIEEWKKLPSLPKPKR